MSDFEHYCSANKIVKECLWTKHSKFYVHILYAKSSCFYLFVENLQGIASRNPDAAVADQTMRVFFHGGLGRHPERQTNV